VKRFHIFFLFSRQLGVPVCIIKPNFIKASQIVAEIPTIFTARRYAKHGICRRRVSICPLLCVSITLRYCIKTAKRRITQIMPHDSRMTLVFWHQSSRRKPNGITKRKPLWGRQIQVGWVIIHHFRQKMRYISKTS